MTSHSKILDIAETHPFTLKIVARQKVHTFMNYKEWEIGHKNYLRGLKKDMDTWILINKYNQIVSIDWNVFPNPMTLNSFPITLYII